MIHAKLVLKLKTSTGMINTDKSVYLSSKIHF